MVLVVNIDGVGDDMLSIPIRGESKSPKVRIEPQEIIQFGDVSLDYLYDKTVTLWNDSNLPAQYKILPQSEEQKVLGTYHVDPSEEKGIINPYKSKEIKVYLMTKWNNQPIRLPLRIEIMGNENKATVRSIVAYSKGPEVECTIDPGAK